MSKTSCEAFIILADVVHTRCIFCNESVYNYITADWVFLSAHRERDLSDYLSSWVPQQFNCLKRHTGINA